MATVRQQQFLDLLTPLLGQIHGIDPTTLVQRERLGSELCFESALPQFIDISAAAEELLKLDLEKIPYGVLQQLIAPFQQIRQLLEQVRGFSPSQHGNARQGRDGLINSIEDQWNAVYVVVRTLLGARNEDGAKKEIDALASQIRTTMQLSSDALKSLNDKKDEVDQKLTAFVNEKASEFTQAGEEKLRLVTAALDEVRKAAAEAGVSQTSRYFKDEAYEHLVSARIWLGALVAMVVALLGFSLFGTFVLTWTGTVEPAADASQILQIKYLAQKGLIVFCLLFGLVWTAKNYGASRHNYVVNKHRNNALGSFQAFASSAADDQTKSAVLVQATQSIFSPQASGYIKNDGDSAPGSPIIEILRSAGGSKEK